MLTKTTHITFGIANNTRLAPSKYGKTDRVKPRCVGHAVFCFDPYEEMFVTSVIRFRCSRYDCYQCLSLRWNMLT